MEKIKFLKGSLISLLVAILLSGCKMQDTNALLTIKVSTSGRAAFPVLGETEEKLIFEVTATPSSNPGANAIVASKFSEESTDYYQMSISEGSWNISVNGYRGENDSDKVDANLILSGNKTITVEAGGKYSDEIPVFFINSNTGSVNLKVDVTGLATHIKVSGTNTALDTVFAAVKENDKDIVTITGTNIESNNYEDVILSFGKNIGTAENPKIAYFFTLPQTINVSKNMTTYTWSEPEISNSSPMISDSGLLCITQTLVNKRRDCTYYVKGTGGKLTATANDESNGTHADPFATVTRAANAIVARNDGIKEYTITLDETIPNTSSSTVVINPNTSLKLKLNKYNGSSSGNASNYPFEINENVTGTFKEVSVGNLTTSGILTIEGGSTKAITLNSNSLDTATISISNANVNGGITCTGENNISLTLDTCTVTDNITTTEKTILTLNDCTIGGTGKTILIAQDCSAEITGGSITGSIICNGSLILKNCTVTGNITNNSGNLILEGSTTVSGEITVADGEILKIRNITSATEVATIVSENPVSKTTILQKIAADGTKVDILEAEVALFKLHNDGFYLQYSPTEKTGWMRAAGVTIQTPTLGNYKISIEACKGSVDTTSSVINSSRDIPITLSSNDAKDTSLVISITDKDGTEKLVPADVKATITIGTKTTSITLTYDNVEKVYKMPLSSCQTPAIYQFLITFKFNGENLTYDGGDSFEITAN